MVLSTLLIFIGLWAGVAWLVWSLRLGLRSLRIFGLGGSAEDLTKARQILRRLGAIGVVLVFASLAIVIMGERWASQWRTLPIGQAFLVVLALLAGAGVAWAYGYTTRQQWSPQGSFKGVLLGTTLSMIASAFLFLTMHWLGA